MEAEFKRSAERRGIANVTLRFNDPDEFQTARASFNRYLDLHDRGIDPHTDDALSAQETVSVHVMFDDNDVREGKEYKIGNQADDLGLNVGQCTSYDPSGLKFTTNDWRAVDEITKAEGGKVLLTKDDRMHNWAEDNVSVDDDKGTIAFSYGSGFYSSERDEVLTEIIADMKEQGVEPDHLEFTDWAACYCPVRADIINTLNLRVAEPFAA